MSLGFAALDGVLRNPGDTYQTQTEWTAEGSITIAQAALAADAMDNASVIALAATKTVIVEPVDGTVSLEFRFRTDGSDGDGNTLEVYAAAGADHYTRIAHLVITQGTQDSTSEHFCDTIAETLQSWPSSSREVVQPGTPDNHIARWLINTHGYDRFLFIVSTLGTTTVHVDSRSC